MTRYPVVLAIAMLAACGGSSNQDVHAPKDMPFKDMNLAQKTAFMKEVVMPRSKELFVAFDPKFQDMNCKTCHGDGADDGSFAMPNPKIRPLPSSEEAFMAWMQKEPDMGKWAGFMAQKLTPAMADMLKMTIHNPKTGQGEFGCTACHTLQPAEGAPAPAAPPAG